MNKNIFNKILMIVTLFITFVLSDIGSIFATEFDVTSSVTQVSAGQRFTVTVSGAIVGRFDASVRNGSLDQSVVFISDIGGSATFTVTAGDSGVVEVLVRATDVADQSYSKVEGVRSISVPIVKSQMDAQSHNQVNDLQKSENNALKSLSVSQGKLTPAFDANIKEYKVSLKTDTESIKVDAKTQDANASVKGIGNIKVKSGDNTIQIKVIAENGSETIYTIYASVEAKPYAYYSFKKEKLGVLSADGNSDKLFNNATIKIDGQEVKCLKNEALHMTLLSMINEKTGIKGYYVFDEKNNKIVSSIKKITFDGRSFYALEPDKEQQKRNGMEYGKIQLGKEWVFGWTFNDDAFKNYALIYTLNEEGKPIIYQYEKSENDLQVYSQAAPYTLKGVEKIQNQSNEQLYLVGMLIAFAVAIITFIYTIICKKRNN